MLYEGNGAARRRCIGGSESSNDSGKQTGSAGRRSMEVAADARSDEPTRWAHPRYMCCVPWSHLVTHYRMHQCSFGTISVLHFILRFISSFLSSDCSSCNGKGPGVTKDTSRAEVLFGPHDPSRVPLLPCKPGGCSPLWPSCCPILRLCKASWPRGTLRLKSGVHGRTILQKVASDCERKGNRLELGNCRC